jgi:Flp pilus assembly protein TadD
MRERLLKRLADGHDDAMLRFGLGNALIRDGDAEGAVIHFERATQHDPTYSAAWKQLGVVLLAVDRPDAAQVAWNRGIEVAERRGDIQAAREMAVFVKRLKRQRPAQSEPDPS